MSNIKNQLLGGRLIIASGGEHIMVCDGKRHTVIDRDGFEHDASECWCDIVPSVSPILDDLPAADAQITLREKQEWSEYP